MIAVQRAEELIRMECLNESIKEVPLSQSPGEILAEDILAQRNQPPFNRVAMDGIALSFKSWEKDHLTSFPIQDIQAAGRPSLQLSESHYCIETMTGAPLPQGCDCIIPYEQLSISQGKAYLEPGLKLTQWQNIHKLGSDYKKGDLLLQKGKKINAPLMGILASEGKVTVKIKTTPSIALVSTGDELVPIQENPEPHQIRLSNPYALKAEIKRAIQREADIFHLKDDPEDIFNSLKKINEEYDIVIITGGVSRGKYDYIPSILKDLNFQQIFHKVKQRPGKPFWFGKKVGGPLVFGLPGNPVSCLTCLRKYIIPFLSQKDTPQKVILNEDFSFSKDLTLFMPVTLHYEDDGTVKASLKRTNGSGDYFTLAKSDGFIQLPEEKNQFIKGECYPFYPWS
jgi:molybdopterin molybdotransferase